VNIGGSADWFKFQKSQLVYTASDHWQNGEGQGVPALLAKHVFPNHHFLIALRCRYGSASRPATQNRANPVDRFAERAPLMWRHRCRQWAFQKGDPVQNCHKIRFDQHTALSPLPEPKTENSPCIPSGSAGLTAKAAVSDSGPKVNRVRRSPSSTSKSDTANAQTGFRR